MKRVPVTNFPARILERNFHENHFSGKNYSVAGKTGTAEVVGRGNNAWFVGFAPADDPKIAICVLVEDAGTASSEAVPIAGEILDAYLNN